MSGRVLNFELVFPFHLHTKETLKEPNFPTQLNTRLTLNVGTIIFGEKFRSECNGDEKENKKYYFKLMTCAVLPDDQKFAAFVMERIRRNCEVEFRVVNTLHYRIERTITCIMRV